MPAKRQSPQYYKTVLRILIDANADNLTYSAIAEVLNSKALLTPTGLRWSEDSIKQIMKKLRLYKIYPSYIHHYLLELIFNGTFSLKECLPLFKSRRTSTL